MNPFVRSGPGIAALFLALACSSPSIACYDEEASEIGRGIEPDPCALCSEYTAPDSVFYQKQYGNEQGIGQAGSISCFAVTRFPAGAGGAEEWVLFDGAGPGGPVEFIRRISTDAGGTWNWAVNPPAHTSGFADFAGASGVTVDNIQCPDPVQLSGGFYMFFNAKTNGGDIWEVWRATSTDRGVTWTDFRKVVRAPRDKCFYPYMPSVVETPAGLLMAVSWTCSYSPNGRYSADDFIRFFTSTNGLVWAPLMTSPGSGVLASFTRSTVINPATGNLQFDSGSANRPRLVLDWSDSNRIHMFYSGYPLAYNWLNRKAPNRTGAGIGHVQSTDGGQTWTSLMAPLRNPLHLPYQATYDELAVKPSVVKHSAGGRKYRLYFQGAGTQSTRSFYAYDYVDSTLATAQPLRREAVAPDPDTSRPPVHVRSIPNPTTGETAVALDFAGLSAPADVEILIVDIQGRLVRKLWSGSSQSAPREITWDGLSRSGSRVATGRYLVQVRSGNASLGSHWVTILR